MTILFTNESDRIKLNVTIRSTKETENFLGTYGHHTVKLFQSQPIAHITRAFDPCHIRLEDGTLFNFSNNAAFFEFLNKASALGYDFALKDVCVDFCRWYQEDLKAKLSKITVATVGDEDWMPTPEQIDHVRDLEHRITFDPNASIFVTKPGDALVLASETGPKEPLPVISDAKTLRELYGLPSAYIGIESPEIFERIGCAENVFETEASLTFSDEPFKTIQDYIHACTFFHPYAPTMLDYANALLAYRLGYQISQEKVAGRIAALHSLRGEVNCYVKNHPERCANLRAEADIDVFNMAPYPDRLVVRSDYGRVVVAYEPDVTAVEWEKRYTDLRTRHGQR